MDFDQIKAINDAYYHALVWKGRTFWRGYPVAKYATDLLIYSDLIFKIRPDLIIESGTYKGGSAQFFADMCKLNGHGRVLSVSNRAMAGLPEDTAITYIVGDSLSARTHEIIRESIDFNQDKTVFVSLDSDHRKAFVSKEIALYKRYVTVGSYLVVEDGNAVFTSTSSEANQALDEFLAGNDEFVEDLECERLLLTTNPRGWLKRITPGNPVLAAEGQRPPPGRGNASRKRGDCFPAVRDRGQAPDPRQPYQPISG